nr:MAG TPA: hypothetical protein [Caudoviricetes sp.]
MDFSKNIMKNSIYLEKELLAILSDTRSQLGY